MPVLALATALALSAGTATWKLPGAPRELYRIRWQQPLVQPVMGEWRPGEPGGAAFDPVARVVVVGTRDGALRALRADGSALWTFKASGPFLAEPAVDGDTVYAACADGKLYALAIGSGKERWRYDAKEALASRPTVAGGLVLVTSLSDTVYAVDAASGEWKWHRRKDGREGFTIRGVAAVVAGQGLAFAGAADGSVAALDLATGIVRWERQVAPAGPYPDVDSLALSAGTLYAAAYSGAVVALEAATGKPLWQVLTPDAARVALAPGAVIAVTGKSVMALSPVDGKALWTVPLSGTPSGEPRVAGRWLLVPAAEGGLRFLELAAGRTIRVLDPGSGVSASPGLAPGQIYVLSNAGRLLALDLR
jgi:outer membrane protein assembly factor BamB